MEIADLRREYKLAALEKEDLRADPFEQFKFWFEQASTAEVLEPNAMVLATVDSSGQPFTRTVLLKDLDARGLVFYTNFESRKAAMIAENPRVSVLFSWLPLERQVSVNGRARKISSAEAFKYFATRPLSSRLGAWTSPQSKIISSRSLLEAKLEEMKRKFADGHVPLPSFWGGYRIEPDSWEFWQGRQSRLHDRFMYSKNEGSEGWTIARLAP